MQPTAGPHLPALPVRERTRFASSPHRLVLVRNEPTLSHGTEKMSRSPVLFRVDAAPVRRLRTPVALPGAGSRVRPRRIRRVCSCMHSIPARSGLINAAATNGSMPMPLLGSPEDIEETVQEIRRLRPAAVVHFDSPDVTEDYLYQLQRTGIMVVSLDSAWPARRFPFTASSSIRCSLRAAKPTSSRAARRCCSAPASPWCGPKCTGTGRSALRNRLSRSA